MANTIDNERGLRRRSLLRLAGATAAIAVADRLGLKPRPVAAESEYGILDSDIGKVVTVKSGDNLWNIARAHNTTVEAIVNANPSIVKPDLIHPGDAFLIPYDQKTQGGKEPLVQSVTMPYERKPDRNPFLTAFDVLRKPFIASGIWIGVVPGGEVVQRVYMGRLTPNLPDPSEIDMRGRGTYFPLETKGYEVIGRGSRPKTAGQIASIEVGPTIIPVSDDAEAVAVDLKVQPIAAPCPFNLNGGQELVRRALAENRTMVFTIDERRQAKSVRIVTS